MDFEFDHKMSYESHRGQSDYKLILILKVIAVNQLPKYLENTHSHLSLIFPKSQLILIDLVWFLTLFINSSW